MTVIELYNKLNERIPRELSCSWDNDGLMCCPDPDRKVNRVLIALDITGAVIDEAIAGGYEVILSHHPLIFHPLKAVEPSDRTAAKVIRLIRANIAAMSFHTRLDSVEGGVNDTLAALLGLSEVTPFGEDGMGRIGRLQAPMSLADFAALVRARTGSDQVVYADGGKQVLRVAVLGGGGSDEANDALKAGADTYLTGDVKHNQWGDSSEDGLNLIGGGHYYTEQPVCAALAEMVKGWDPSIETHITNSCVTTAL